MIWVRQFEAIPSGSRALALDAGGSSLDDCGVILQSDTRPVYKPFHQALLELIELGLLTLNLDNYLTLYRTHSSSVGSSESTELPLVR